MGSTVLPSKVPRQRLGLEHKPSAFHHIQNLDPSSSWRSSPSEATVRGRGEHTGQGKEGTSLNAKDGRKEGARLGSLPPEKGRKGERR